MWITLTNIPQQVLREVHLWSKLRHENIVPLLGIVTRFDCTISLVSEWMHRGNAYQYVQNTDVDPRPLVNLQYNVEEVFLIAPHICFS